jgi:hypothetical protein
MRRAGKLLNCRGRGFFAADLAGRLIATNIPFDLRTFLLDESRRYYKDAVLQTWVEV